MASHRALAAAVAGALVVAACGSGAEDVGSEGPAGSSAVSTTIAAESTGGDTANPARGSGAGETTGPAPPAVTGAETAHPERETSGAEGGGAEGAGTSEERAGTSVYLAPAGEYVYDVSGHVETSGLTNSREPAPSRSTDEITISRTANATRMTVATRDDGGDSTQEVVVEVTDTEARLVRLGYQPDSGGVAYAVDPDPPALLARLPYRAGDSWEIAWSDPSIGISGAGTGAVTGRETITTPAGTFDVVVITVDQRLRGTIEGTLTVTSWIDPATGIQAKQHLVSEFRDATGATRSDTTRTLRSHPG